MGEKVLMKGNEAFAEAAMRSGCQYYFGYPITPQNEVTEYMSRELKKRGGGFVQAESELAAVNMAFGAAVCGGRVLISSSSPGIALMQEGMSFLASTNMPAVVLNVSRGGPGIGCIQPGQADYYQATRGGGNGDYHLIVLAPSSIQEAVDMMQVAFDLADEYRNPVMILADGTIGQMMEPVMLPEPKTLEENLKIRQEKTWALSGHENKREHNVSRSVYLKPEVLHGTIMERQKKYEKAKKELVQYETSNLEGADVVLVAFGISYRIAKDAAELLKKDGIQVGMIRPISLWPYPNQAFDEIDSSTKVVISVELNMGQMIDDVKIACNGRFPVSLINETGGLIFTSQEIAEKVKTILEGK